MTTRASQLAQRTRPLQSRRLELAQTLYAWLSTWEIYPILLVASFLRFYQLSTTEFDADQAILFRMAHDACLTTIIFAASDHYRQAIGSLSSLAAARSRQAGAHQPVGSEQLPEHNRRHRPK